VALGYEDRMRTPISLTRMQTGMTGTCLESPADASDNRRLPHLRTTAQHNKEKS